MKILFSVLAMISMMMVFIAGSGAYLISKTLISQYKVDAVSSAAKGIAYSLSEQIKLYDRILEKMAQDPDVINAVVQKNPQLLGEAEKKLAAHFPNVIHIKLILADQLAIGKDQVADLSFADQEMVKQTLVKIQSPAVQGDGNERHLAIAHKITQNDTALAVVLATIKYDFLNAVFSTVALEKGYLELRQDKLVLSSTGDSTDDISKANAPISVPETNWKIYFDNSAITNFFEFSLIFSITLIPALMVALSFATGYRKFNDLLRVELGWLIKAGKEILNGKPPAEYPIKLHEVGIVVSTLAQFQRVVSDKRLDI